MAKLFHFLIRSGVHPYQPPRSFLRLTPVILKKFSLSLCWLWLSLSLGLVACTDQPPAGLSIFTPTASESQHSTAEAALPAPSTPTPVIVIPFSTPEPTPTLAVNGNVIGNPQSDDEPTPTPTPPPVPQINGKLPDLAALPIFVGNPTGTHQIVQIFDQSKDDQGQPNPLLAAALSPDHQWLALADSGQIWVYSMLDGHLLNTLYTDSSEWTERGAHSLAWSLDGNFLAAGGLNGLITMWRWDHPSNNFRAGPLRLAPSAMAEAFGDRVEVAFSPDNKLVAGFGSDGSITVYTADTGAIAANFTSDFAGYLSWAPDSKRLVDEFFLLHYLGSGLSILPDDDLAVAADGPEGIAWSPDGKKLAGSGDGFELLIVAAPDLPATGQPDPAATQILQDVKIPEDSDQTSLPHLKEGRRVAWSPDSSVVAVANVPQAGQVSLYDSNTGDRLLQLDAGSATITSLSFPANTLIVTGANDGVARLWQVTGPPPPTPTPTPVPTTPTSTTPKP